MTQRRSGPTYAANDGDDNGLLTLVTSQGAGHGDRWWRPIRYGTARSLNGDKKQIKSQQNRLPEMPKDHTEYKIQ